MADQLFFERFIWFDAQVRKDKYPNASKLATHFELSTKTAQRSIDYFRDFGKCRRESGLGETVKGGI